MYNIYIYIYIYIYYILYYILYYSYYTKQLFITEEDPEYHMIDILLLT